MLVTDLVHRGAAAVLCTCSPVLCSSRLGFRAVAALAADGAKGRTRRETGCHEHGKAPDELTSVRMRR